MSKQSWKKGIRSASPAALIVAALPLASCSSETLGTECGANISAKIEALHGAVEELALTVDGIEARLTSACNAIAVAGGEAEGADVKTACASANLVIDAEFSGNAAVYIDVVPGYCTIDAQAQFDCEAGCEVSGSCDFSPGAVEARCEPGEFSVTCEGSCNGTAYCEAAANVAAACEGSCQGECQGSCTVDLSAGGVCDGVCNGQCEGTEQGGTCEGVCKGQCELTGSAAASCTGVCEGSCTGRCEFVADASVTCDAEVRCQGSCDGTARAPRCDVEIEPPSAECDLDAECQASCEANASLDYECVPPSIAISAQADIDVDVRAALETNLSIVYEILAEADVLAGAVVNVPTHFVSAAEAALQVPACALSYGADFVASAQASVDISVKLEASASASGSIAGSTTSR